MRNIWRIIKADARSLFTHFFALAVALAIAVLPSLYAWLNIYSNWDPYGNTGNISIAVASLDKGWTEEDGTQVNKGREVVEDLRSSTSINWVIVDTKEEAQRGVYAGDYYAAVVIDEDFSYNMYHMLTEWTGKPTITYYENYKKNAVATKITDTAVSSLKTTISKSYLDVVVDAIFRGANDLSQQLSQEDPVGSVQGLLGQTRSLLRSCAKTIDAFQAAGQDNSSYRQDLSDLVSNINQNRPNGQEILDTVAQLNRKVHAALDKARPPWTRPLTRRRSSSTASTWTPSCRRFRRTSGTPPRPWTTWVTSSWPGPSPSPWRPGPWGPRRRLPPSAWRTAAISCGTS